MMYDTTDSPWPFKRNGYTTAMVPNLSFTIIIVMVTGMWFFFASFFLIGKVTVKDNCFKRFLAFSAERSFYTALMFACLELTIFSTTNIIHPKFNHIGNMLSFVVSVLTLITMFCIPVILFKASNHFITTLWNPEYYERYGFMFCEFKLNSKIRKCFMSVIMTRIVLFGFLLAALATMPIPQTIAVLFVHLFYFVVLLKVRPFVSLIMHILTSVAEFFVLVSSFCFMITAIDNSKNILKSVSSKERLDLINCFAIFFAVVFLVLGILFMVVMKIVQIIRRAVSKKKYQSIAPAKKAVPEAKEKGLMDQQLEDAPAVDNPELNKFKNEEELADDDFLGSGGTKKVIDNNDFENEFLAERRVKDDDIDEAAF